MPAELDVSPMKTKLASLLAFVVFMTITGWYKYDEWKTNKLVMFNNYTMSIIDSSDECWRNAFEHLDDYSDGNTIDINEFKRDLIKAHRVNNIRKIEASKIIFPKYRYCDNLHSSIVKYLEYGDDIYYSLNNEISGILEKSNPGDKHGISRVNTIRDEIMHIDKARLTDVNAFQDLMIQYHKLPTEEE